MAEFQGLPLYEAKIDMNDEETGIYCISLVDLPATESNFLAFDAQKELLKYSVQNEEQHKVFGLVMAADTPIYRRNADGYEYYITYSRETIAQMAEKVFKQGNQNNVDTQHNFELENGITMCEMFIKDTEKGITPKGYEDYADGSLFATFHIENDDVWNGIKDGSYKGFSLAGVFNIDEIELNKQNKIENKIMSKLNNLKAMLRQLMELFGNVSTDKGALSYASEGELPEIGEEVFIVAEDGSEAPAEDGDYTTEDGTVIVVAEGKVAEIREVEKPADEPKAEEETPAEPEEPKAEEEAEEEQPAEPAAPAEDERDAKIAEYEARIAELEAENADLKAKIEELENASAAKPAEEEFENVNKPIKTGNKGLDRLSRILNA